MEFTQFAEKHNLRIVGYALKSAAESRVGWSGLGSDGKPLTEREVQRRQEQVVYPASRSRAWSSRLPLLKRIAVVRKDSEAAKANAAAGRPVGTVMHAEHGPLVPVEGWRSYPAYGWTLTLGIGAGERSVHNTVGQDFYRGIASAVAVEPGGRFTWQRDDYSVFAKPPTIGEVLQCIASDCQSIEDARNFEEWASEFGFDTDSRKAERTYNACRDEAQTWRTFLGLQRYGELLACREDGTEEEEEEYNTESPQEDHNYGG